MPYFEGIRSRLDTIRENATDDGGLDVSLSTAAVTAVIIVILADLFAPASIADRIPVIGALTAVDSLALGFWTVAGLLVWWVFRSRFLRGKSTTSSLTRDVRRQAESLVDVYLTWTRVALATLLAFGFLFLGQLGEFIGDFGSMFMSSDGPLIVGNLVTGLLGFLSLGGSVSIPQLNVTIAGVSLSANEFGVIALAVFVVAVVMHYS